MPLPCPRSGALCPPALSSPVPTVNAFWVTVQRTEAAERCELRGTYVLKAERDSLVLKDPRTDRILYVWPYRLLRRYGRDKVGTICHFDCPQLWCHHAGVWAGRTFILSVVVPLSLRPLPLLLSLSIPALPSLCHEQGQSSVLHTSSPQAPGTLALGSPVSALGSVPPS